MGANEHRGEFTLYADRSGARIPVTVTRKPVTHLNLRIRRDARVVLSIPCRAGLATAQDFLDRRAGWIARGLKRLERRAEAARALETEGGAGTVPLWGRLVPAPVATPREHGARALEALYRDEIGGALEKVAARAEARVGVRAASWRVRRMTSRWGSCTPATGAVRISSNLAAFPPACLECVVTHELVHLIEASHSARFHRLLDLHCPDNRALTAMLRRPARELAAERA